MKVKLKNANAITALLLAHGEKIGIVAIGAVALLLVWKSLGREQLGENRQPEALKTAATKANNDVNSVVWNNIPKESRVTAEDAIEDPSLAVLSPVRDGDFPSLQRPFDSPVIIPLSKRQDPVILAPLEPEVHGGAGLWLSGDPEVLREKRLEALARQQKEQLDAEAERLRAERDADQDRDRRRGRGGRDRDRDDGNLFGGGMGGGVKTKDGAIIVPPTSGAQLQGLEDVRNRYWVTVLAKIPVAQQYQMYEDALKNTRGYDPTKDVPDYFGYQVQRAEITAEGQGEWKSLGDVTVEGIQSVMRTWPVTQTTELVSPQYLHPVLTFPLPPMILRPWGDEITHSDLPLQTPEMILAELEAEAAAMTEAGSGEENDEEKTAFDRIADLKRSLNERDDPNRMMWGPEGAEGFEGGGRGMLMPGRGYGPEGGMSGMARLDEGSGALVLPTYNWDGRTEFVLFRYFDSRVEPGKQYKYRIRLVLSDVNANQPESLLDDKVKERKQKSRSGYFFTDWSEESPVATVPQPGLVFVKGAKISNNPNVSESEAELLIKSLNSDYAAEIGVADLFTRGSVLNLQRQAQIIWSSSYDVQQQPDSPTFDLFTGQTLVDFDGGEKLGGRAPLAPVRALLMDASGRMTVYNELDNAQPVAEFNAVIEADKAAASQRRNEDDRGDRRRGRER